MKKLILSLLLLLSPAAFAQTLDLAKPDPVVESRLKGLAEELRCLVCQNQTIADSNAPLALDLRNQIRTQIAQGRSDDQIRGYMVERYGDFVLYKPPLKATTMLLWIGPFLMIALGAVIFAGVVRRRREAPVESALEPSRREEIEALLDDAPVKPAAATPPRKKIGKGRG
jgi:cytochrome c-type biogenesis protein CcmH